MKVIFNYDEKTRKWDPIVQGAETPLEARQAFVAVVLTCQGLDSDLLKHSKTESFNFGADIRIIPAHEVIMPRIDLLQSAVDLIENHVEDENFDMLSYHYKDVCRSQKCFLGWGGTLPEWISAGIVTTFNGFQIQTISPLESDVNAVCRILGMEKEDVFRLFYPDDMEMTREEVLDEVKKYIKEKTNAK